MFLESARPGDQFGKFCKLWHDEHPTTDDLETGMLTFPSKAASFRFSIIISSC